MSSPDLRERWYETMRLVGVTAEMTDPVNWLYASVLSAYSEPHRRYHGIGHLRSCFRVLDTYFPAVPLHGAVEMALWFHDFYYDTHALDNEEKSAEEAMYAIEESLDLPADFSQDVQALILATKHDGRPVGHEEDDNHAIGLFFAKNVLIDVDLSILGAQPDVFDAYEQQIREKYSWVPEDDFRAGRMRIIQEFLQRPRSFYNDCMYVAGYEVRADENLRRSLRKLSGGAQ